MGQGLVCVHIRGGNVDHWPGITTFLRGSMGLTLQEDGPLARYVGGYVKPGRDGARAGFGHRLFSPRTQIEQVQVGKAGIDMSAEMKQNRETGSMGVKLNFALRASRWWPVAFC